MKLTLGMLPRWQRSIGLILVAGWLVLLSVFGITFGVVFCAVLLLALAALVGSYCAQQAGRGGRWLPRLRRTVYALTLLWLISLVLLLRLIFSEPHGAVPPTATHVIVLGAGLHHGDRLSLVLQSRLDRTLLLLRQFPSLQVIVSGGQGPNETLSEAAAMQRYLRQHGISAARIIEENRSTTTRENLRFSHRLLPHPHSRVLVLSSDFHIYRAQRIARRQGLNSTAIAADTPGWVLVNYAIREYFALLKDYYTA